jgi:RNA polymerase sigma factor (sigma-70 family)
MVLGSAKTRDPPQGLAGIAAGHSTGPGNRSWTGCVRAAAEETLIDRHAASLEGLVDIDDALMHLPVSQRVVLVLRTQEGLSEQEIATTLGIPTGTVKSRLHRARAAFREVWES